MLGVNRINSQLRFIEQPVDEVTGHNKSFFIGKRYILAGLYRMYGRLKAAVSDGSCQHHIDVRSLHALGERFRTGCGSYAMRLQRCTQLRQQTFITDNGKPRLVTQRKPDEIIGTAPGGKYLSLIQLRMLFNYIECLAAYRTGGTKHSYSFWSMHNCNIKVYNNITVVPGQFPVRKAARGHRQPCTELQKYKFLVETQNNVKTIWLKFTKIKNLAKIWKNSTFAA